MISRAIKSLIPNTVPLKFHFRAGQERTDFSNIEWPQGFTPPTWEEVSARAAEIEAEDRANRAATAAETRRLAYLDDIPDAIDAILEHLDQKAAAELPPKLCEIIAKKRAHEQPEGR